MRQRRIRVLLPCLAALPLLWVAPALASEKTELRGKAILDHACGKVALKYMSLSHAGKMEEAVKLGTAEMQEQWKAMPAEERQMMSEMMKEMSKTEEEYSADIVAHGLLVVEGPAATLTVEKKTEDASGTSTETSSQRYAIDGTGCRISR
jgi:hypothetical protein